MDSNDDHSDRTGSRASASVTVTVSVPYEVDITDEWLDDPTEEEIRDQALEIMYSAPAFDHINESQLSRAEVQSITTEHADTQLGN